MKTTILMLFAVVMLAVTGCDHKAELITKVNEDGSLEKTIILLDAEHDQISRNYFGISAENGWQVMEEPSGIEGKSDKRKITFTRKFADTGEFNDALNHEADTLFRIKSDFEKEFRWFFTYMHYSETFGAADRFRYIDQSDFFTPEDYAFIERLPADGQPVSKADSIYADLLNKKIMDVYAMNGIVAGQLNFFKSGIDKYNLDQSWKDSLDVLNKKIFNMLAGEEGDSLPEDIFLVMTDSIGIPYPHPQIDRDFKLHLERQENRLNFMSWVTDGTYVNQIEMPWTVVFSNADHSQDNVLSWSPPNVKLLLQDYTMRVSSRKINYWAIIVTGIVIMLGSVFLFKKGK